jgi:hypothetical protein
VILGAIAVGLCVLLAVAVLSIARSLSHTQQGVGALKTDLRQLREEIAANRADRAQVEELLNRADRISSRVESTSKTLASPVIKAFALGAGTRSAAQRLRRNSNGQNGH